MSKFVVIGYAFGKSNYAMEVCAANRGDAIYEARRRGMTSFISTQQIG